MSQANYAKLNLFMNKVFHEERLAEIQNRFCFDPYGRTIKKINFTGNPALRAQDANGHVSCENLSENDFLSWSNEASRRMLEFRKTEHDLLFPKFDEIQ